MVTGWVGFGIISLAVLAIGVYGLFIDITTKGANPECWDWMYYSGATAFLVTVALAINTRDELAKAIAQLRINHTLKISTSELEQLNGQLELSVGRWRIAAGLFVGALVLATWIWALAVDFPRHGVDLAYFVANPGWAGFVVFVVAVMTFCGYLAGSYFGTAAGRGSLATLLAQDSVTLRIQPDHYDGAVGLKPIGDLYLYQAFLTAIPLVYFSIWWLIIPQYKQLVCASVDPSSWAVPMAAQWFVTLGFTYLAFVRPVMKLRRRLRQEQLRLQKLVVPELSSRILTLQEEFASSDINQHRREELVQEIDRAGRRVWSIQQMSAWPMDTKTRRRYFSLTTLTTVIPPVLDASTSLGFLSGGGFGNGNFGWLKSIAGTIF